jgi:predicted small lipoprotein YifL
MRNIALIISLTVTLSACGLKGPLYIPAAESTPTAEAERKPQPQENIEQR